MAVTPAPAVDRIGRLLDALADRPRSTLADLARATSISKATAHSLLLGLTDIGFVRRTDDPVAYSLGPALVALGERARAGVDLAEVAQDVLAELSRATGCTAMAGTARGSTISVLAAHSPPHPFGVRVQPGTHLPFAAPVGGLYAAWATPAVVRRWLDRADPPLSERRRRAVESELATIRARGWSATLRTRATGPGRATGAGTGTGAGIHEADERDLAAGGDDLDVLGVSAPVLDASGQLECSIAAADLPRPLSGRQLLDLAHHVLAAAGRMASAIAAARAGRATRP